MERIDFDIWMLHDLNCPTLSPKISILQDGVSLWPDFIESRSILLILLSFIFFI